MTKFKIEAFFSYFTNISHNLHFIMQFQMNIRLQIKKRTVALFVNTHTRKFLNKFQKGIHNRFKANTNPTKIL